MHHIQMHCSLMQAACQANCAILSCLMHLLSQDGSYATPEEAVVIHTTTVHWLESHKFTIQA